MSENKKRKFKEPKRVVCILKQSKRGLGSVASIVNVRPGFYRNFLRPKNVAEKFSQRNIEEIQILKETSNVNLVEELKKQEEILKDKCLFFVRQASSLGVLYGSVSKRDVVEEILKDFNIKLSTNMFQICSSIKHTGVFKVEIDLEHDMCFKMSISVGKTLEEAKAFFKN